MIIESLQQPIKRGIDLADVVTFSRMGQQYMGTYIGFRDVCGTVLLRPDNSDVEIEVSSGIGPMNACVHLDALPFSEVLPENECLVSPIIEVNAYPIHQFKIKCRIRLPHCLRKSDLHSVIVRHGDIYKNKPFVPVPCKDETAAQDEYFEIDESYVYIYASSFSQFTCTTCKRKCADDQVMFLSAGFTPCSNGSFLEMWPFICSPLFNIPEYRRVCENFQFNNNPVDARLFF